MSSLNTRDTAEYHSKPNFGSGFFVPLAPAVDVTVGGTSHAGRVREHNEDHFAVFRRTRTQETLRTNLDESAVPTSTEEAFGFLVADGMGGPAAGEVASRVAIETAWDLTERASSWVMRLRSLSAQQIQERAEAYLTEMHRTLRELGETDPNLFGMGTTLTSVYVVGWSAIVVQVGDSRAYLWREGDLRQITRDQSLAQVLIDSGIPVEQTAGVRHILTNSLGGKSKLIVPNVDHVRLQNGDRLLLATDGLTDQVSDSEINDTLRLHLTPQATCDALIELALDHGGRDNVTVVVGDFAERQPSPSTASTSSREDGST
jgi:PPM family protein phosphatase